MMLQLEISQVCIKEANTETKIKLTNDIMRLLQVREKNEDMQKDWLLFVCTSNFKITAGEIYLAFKMALSREINDDKGREIDLFPELSNNATGKVISAYLKHKTESEAYNRSKEKLKHLNLPEKTEPTKQELEGIRNEFLKIVFEDIRNNGYSSDAWQLYSELDSSGKLKMSIEDKKKLYAEELKKYIPSKMEEIRKQAITYSAKHPLLEFKKTIESGKNITAVQNNCRNIMVSNYLKNYIKNFEEFKKNFRN